MRCLAAVTTTWILIGRGNVADHLIRSRRQHPVTTCKLSTVGPHLRIQVRGRSWSSIAVDVATDVDREAVRLLALTGGVPAAKHLILG
jgi:hypothetical protein